MFSILVEHNTLSQLVWKCNCIELSPPTPYPLYPPTHPPTPQPNPMKCCIVLQALLCHPMKGSPSPPDTPPSFGGNL